MIKTIKTTAYVLALIGALSWGFVGIFGFDLVAFLLGETSTLSKLIYSIIGISAAFLIISDMNSKINY